MDNKQCTNCGTELSPNLPRGLCPACLLESGMAKLNADTVPATGATATTIKTSAGAMRRFGEYEVVSEIARGGQGVVFRARHIALNRDVALKMLPLSPWATEAHVKRFRTEARATAELDHPGIVPIYDIGEVDGQHYFTMKLIEGIGLNRLSEPLSARRAAEIIVDAARALQHAHDHGVLHRDIKPGNILLDPAGRPHVTDFGLAKLVEGDSTVTQTRELLGTPSYVSPEMAQGDTKRIGVATDVYGLGAVLYQLLTGNPPFAGGTTLETIRQVIEAEPRRPRLWNQKVDRDLEIICLKCLEKEPARRYASASALADDLERWLRHEPIHARPGGVSYRVRKWLRRNSKAALALAAGLIVAAIALVVKPSTQAAAAPSIGVLLRPADPESKYLSTEFSRNLIRSIGQLPGARVAPRSSVLKFETNAAPPIEAARALGVPTLLAGTVKQAEDMLELQAELIDVTTGARRWSRTFREKLSEGLEVQAQITRVVAVQLGLELGKENRTELRRPLTTNRDAWLHYLKARRFRETLDEPNLLKAVEEYERAIAADPDFAHAYAGLADAHFDLGYTFRDPAVHLPKAKALVREALRRDETLVEALLVDGAVKFFFDWDWTGSETALKHGVLLDPSALENHACYLHSLETVGRVEEALHTVKLASAQHPNSIAIQSELGCAAYYAGRLEEAAAYWKQALANDPENSYLHWGVGRTLAQLGRFGEAEAVLQAGQKKPGGEWSAIVAELAYLLGRTHRSEQARALIATLQTRSANEYVDPYLLAMAYAGVGDIDEIFRHLDRAIAGRSSWIPSLPVDPKFTPFREEPRFTALLEKLKLPMRR
jgi:tetratricopeptide (TPR) repeat protein/predicted Ser/Thr protein kinase